MLFLDLIQEGNMGLIKVVRNLILVKDLNSPLMQLGGFDKQLQERLPTKHVQLEFQFTWLKQLIS